MSDAIPSVFIYEYPTMGGPPLGTSTWQGEPRRSGVPTRLVPLRRRTRCLPGRWHAGRGRHGVPLPQCGAGRLPRRLAVW